MASDSFLPETLDGWIKLIMQLGGLLTIVWAFTVAVIRKPLVSQLNGFGRRLRTSEETTKVHDGKIEALERHEELRSFWQSTTSERLGKMEGSHEKLQEQVAKEMNNLGQRLAGIESSLAILVSNLQRGRNE